MFRRAILNDTSIQASDLTAEALTVNNTAHFLGTVNGFNTSSDSTSSFSYNPVTRTFYISTPQNAVNPSMLISGRPGQLVMNNGVTNLWQTVVGDSELKADGALMIRPAAVDNSKIVNPWLIINNVKMVLGTSNVLTSSNISEGSNLFFTNARAGAAAILTIKTINAFGSEATLSYSLGQITINPISTNSITLTKMHPSAYSVSGVPSTLILRDVSGGVLATAVDNSGAVLRVGTQSMGLTLGSGSIPVTITGNVSISGSLLLNNQTIVPRAPLIIPTPTLNTSYVWNSSATVLPNGLAIPRKSFWN